MEIDPTGKQNGRGAYICPRVECFKAAVKGHRFQKAFDIALSPELIQELEGKLAGS